MQMDQLDFTQAPPMGRADESKWRPAKFSKAALGIRSKAFTQKELRLFTSIAARLLQGGVPLLKALQVIENQMQREKSKKIVHEIIRRIQEGASLSHALESFPAVFPKYFSRTVQAGELTGSVGPVLESLADHLRKEEQRRKTTWEALAYPCFVLFAAGMTVLVLMRFVIPKIASVYTDSNAELPFLTRLVLGANEPMAWLAAAIIAACAVLFTVGRKEWFAHLAFRLPGVGDFLRKSFLAQFSSLLSLELSQGVPMLAALDHVASTASFAACKDSIMKLRACLAEGGSFSEAQEGAFWLDEMSHALIRAGEDSGKLPQTLHEIYKDAVLNLESKSRLYLKIMEPLLILAVGFVVGVIVLSALLPVLEMNALIK